MKVIAVFSNMYPSKEHPTFGIFVKNQVELLRAAAIYVDVIAIDNPGKGKVTALKKYLSWLFRSFFYMMKNRKKLSLTHAHYAFPSGFLSMMGKKLFKIPYVVTVHGGDIDQMVNIHPLIAKMTGQILHHSERVIVVGEKLKKDVVEKFSVEESKIEVMSMGVDTSIFKQQSKEDVRGKLGLQLDEPIILYVGNIIRAKGITELVDAFKSLQQSIPNLQLVLIGSSKDEAFFSGLQEMIMTSTGIHHLEPQPQKVIAEWMAAADVFVLPSYHEGFGLVALEAMAVGTNVVGSDVGGLTFLLAEDAGILVESKKSESLRRGLEKALSDEHPINKEIARQRVAENAFDSIQKRLLALYEEVGK